jgi:hypothetical protein
MSKGPDPPARAVPAVGPDPPGRGGPAVAPPPPPRWVGLRRPVGTHWQLSLRLLARALADSRRELTWQTHGPRAHEVSH